MGLGRLTVMVLATSLILGCGDEDPEPIAYSETISLKLGGIKEGEVEDGQAAEDKSVTTESGNPYGEFLKTARARLGGVDPSAIVVSSIDVRVHADTEGINGLEELFESIEVFLADSKTTIAIGTVDGPSGTSVSVPVGVVAADLEPLQDSLLKSEIKVGVRGPVVDPTPADKFELRLTVDIAFEALP